MHKKGFTLIEIIVATLILALVTTGLAYVFVAGKRHMLHIRSKIQAAELGRLFLASLQMNVRQDTWNQSPVDPPPNNLLTVGNYKSTNNPFPDYSGYTVVSWLAEPSLDAITYYPVYEIIGVPNTLLRRVKLTICWNE